MSGVIPPLPQYAFMAWCLLKAQGQLYLYLKRYLFVHPLNYLHGVESLFFYECETWSFALREEHVLRVFENGVLRRIFGPMIEEVTTG
jgi:hypothetical protein